MDRRLEQMLEYMSVAMKDQPVPRHNTGAECQRWLMHGGNPFNKRHSEDRLVGSEQMGIYVGGAKV